MSILSLPKKIESFFHLYPIYHQCVIRIYAMVRRDTDVKWIKERRETALRRDTDVKWIKEQVCRCVLLAALRRDTDVKWISQIRTGECGWQLKRYHCHVWRRYSQGESISPSLGLSTFFYVLIHHIAACKFERLVYLNTYRLTVFRGLSAERINAYHISSRSSVAVNRWHNERWLMI
jgi:hypothetical protein